MHSWHDQNHGNFTFHKRLYYWYYNTFIQLSQYPFFQGLQLSPYSLIPHVNPKMSLLNMYHFSNSLWIYTLVLVSTVESPSYQMFVRYSNFFYFLWCRCNTAGFAIITWIVHFNQRLSRWGNLVFQILFDIGQRYSNLRTILHGFQIPIIC